MTQLTGSTFLSGTVYVLLVAGIAVAVVAFLGCYGASREIKCMLFMYFIIVSLLFVVILIGGILGYVYREKFTESLQQRMRDSMQLYRNRKDITVAWDFAQRTAEFPRFYSQILEKFCSSLNAVVFEAIMTGTDLEKCLKVAVE
ncbi:hypothetical protein QAD02_006638 [Eretmocerus hayati]|uniref:Uncharacterized protein n=1 Tax=Eretmocerus hayati TaxID=131215 RepID=A0ACC2N2M8_9HYME|nr:hypothetical protein QAD02_006638 [Eretmocerus hayati]